MGKTGPAVTSALYELILKRELFPLNFSDGFIFFVCLKIQWNYQKRHKAKTREKSKNVLKYV